MSALNQAYDMLKAKIEEYGDARYDEGREPMPTARTSAVAMAEVCEAIEALIKQAYAE